MHLLLATTNAGKIEKIRHHLEGIPVAIVSPAEVGLSDIAIEENGTTAEENARLKARGFFNVATQRGIVDVAVLADDGGVEIDALDGRPGILAHRWAGDPPTDERIIAHTMKELEGVPMEKRTARFRVVQCIIFPDGHEEMATGTTEGRILEAARVNKTPGLPYSGILSVTMFGKTLDDLSPEELAQTHRGQAMGKIRAIIMQNLPSYA